METRTSDVPRLRSRARHRNRVWLLFPPIGAACWGIQGAAAGCAAGQTDAAQTMGRPEEHLRGKVVICGRVERKDAMVPWRKRAGRLGLFYPRRRFTVRISVPVRGHQAGSQDAFLLQDAHVTRLSATSPLELFDKILSKAIWTVQQWHLAGHSAVALAPRIATSATA